MRYSPEHKQQSRARILRTATQRLRVDGPERLSVHEVMAGAELTHGAFYAHFASKEALVAEALDAMFGDPFASGKRLDTALADPQGDVPAALHGFLANYLSAAHRDGAGSGCPLPALASDMARNAGPARDRFGQGLLQVSARIAAALQRLGHENPDAAAHRVLAQIVGAITLARALGSGPPSDAILHDNLRALEKELDL